MRTAVFLLLSLALGGCSADPAPIDAGPTPAARSVASLAEVQTALQPRAEERGVLLALWASW